MKLQCMGNLERDVLGAGDSRLWDHIYLAEGEEIIVAEDSVAFDRER